VQSGTRKPKKSPGFEYGERSLQLKFYLRLQNALPHFELKD